MPIEFKCGCGKRLQAPDGAGGEIVECPACGRRMTVPSQAKSQQKISVACSCGKMFRAPAHMAGHSVNCPNCGGLLTIPDISYDAAEDDTFQVDVPAPESVAPESGAPAGTYDVAERKCPSCGVAAPANVQFCVECGTNLATGERVEDLQEQKSAAAEKGKPNWLPVLLALGIFGFSLAVGLLTFIAVR